MFVLNGGCFVCSFCVYFDRIVGHKNSKIEIKIDTPKLTIDLFTDGFNYIVKKIRESNPLVSDVYDYLICVTSANILTRGNTIERLQSGSQKFLAGNKNSNDYELSQDRMYLKSIFIKEQRGNSNQGNKKLNEVMVIYNDNYDMYGGGSPYYWFKMVHDKKSDDMKLPGNPLFIRLAKGARVVCSIVYFLLFVECLDGVCFCVCVFFLYFYRMMTNGLQPKIIQKVNMIVFKEEWFVGRGNVSHKVNQMQHHMMHVDLVLDILENKD